MNRPTRTCYLTALRVLSAAMAPTQGAAIALFLLATNAPAQAMHHHHMAMSANGEVQPVSVAGLVIPDTTLIDQHGHKVRFYSDLVKDKVVAINTIFTTCTTICPLMGANFSKVERLIGDAGRKAQLISISIDPSVDTPDRLEAWSKNFGQPGPGWTLVTGAKPDVDALLKALQIFTSDKQDHAPVVLIGGNGSGNWIRTSALTPPARIAELIQSRLQLMGAPTQARH